MHVAFNPKFQKQICTIHPGEYYCSREDEMISTILGSCVSVVLFDTKLEMAGMNHFMLPGNENNKNVFESENGRYGINAMELLINSMIKKGGNKRNWITKVFGGGHVLSGVSNSSVPDKNIAFALKFLETEGFNVVAKDLGGDTARKIFLFTKTGKVLLKHVSTDISHIKKEEEAYENSVKSKNIDLGKNKSGDFISFTDFSKRN